jgi:hypothetical protein
MGKKGLLRRIKAIFAGLRPCKQVRLRHSYYLDERRIRVSVEDLPLQLLLGGKQGKVLELHPELPLNAATARTSVGWLLIDPESYFHSIGGALRLAPGAKLSLDADDPRQRALFAFPDTMAQTQLAIENDHGSPIFHSLVAESRTCITPLYQPKDRSRLARHRLQQLHRLRSLVGVPVAPLPADRALDLLQRVNALMAREPYRLACSDGDPGAVLRLPDEPTPILVADLHAQADNLLTVLTQGGLLDALERGEAMLVIIGDAVHSEIDGQMEEMSTSMALMDLILTLKLRLPERVFYLRGNHDSFSDELAKDGIPQGLLWARALRNTRGKEYEKQMQVLYDRLPYLAYCSRFVACHAGPPTRRTDLQGLIEAARNPKLAKELTTNRMQRPNRPAGYTKGDIKRLRKVLGLPKQVPLIVGHTPLNRDDTLWMDAGGFRRHHILYSANPSQVGAMTWVQDILVPLRCPSEDLSTLFNALDSREVEREFTQTS